VSAEASDGEKRLYTHLFTNASYNRQIRPRRDPTHTVVVDVELDLNHLIKLARLTILLSTVYSVWVAR